MLAREASRQKRRETPDSLLGAGSYSGNAVSDNGPTHSYIAEWYWPGVREAALSATVARADAVASQLRREGGQIDFRGTILVRTDETVFCLFDGRESDIRAAGELAGRPFERILESLWFAPGDPSDESR
jgi:hypothetical protein